MNRTAYRIRLQVPAPSVAIVAKRIESQPKGDPQ